MKTDDSTILDKIKGSMGSNNWKINRYEQRLV